ncbi:uncharacterized protein [Montipora foliosa]|uniref:uncharacterized protein n=1 Tax=Montipora foliosa TaxID=591990 RepID=UPI0035F17A82
MNSTACVIFISFLCAADLTQSKTTNHGEKDGKGIYSTSSSHIENQWNITSDLAERRTIQRLLRSSKKGVSWVKLLLKNSNQEIEAVNLPGSNGYAKLIPEKKDKKKYLESEGRILPSIAKELLDKELIVSPQLRTMFFYDDVYGPCKAIKLFDKESISQIVQNKAKDFKKGNFKAFGVLPLDPVYKNNKLTLQRGHIIGAKLFAENDVAYWFSYNFFNAVPMYSAFNQPIFYQKMERVFLKFAQEAASSGDTVYLMVSISPDTRFDIQMRLGVRAKESWFGPVNRQINIPQSVSVLAISLSKTGKVGKVFAFVGNNDMSFPEGYIPSDLTELEDYYMKDADLASWQAIKHLKKVGYTMWYPK